MAEIAEPAGPTVSTSDGAPSPAPNWYADPGQPGWLRYWDGTAWTGQARPVAGPAAAPRKRIPWIRVARVVVALVIGLGGGIGWLTHHFNKLDHDRPGTQQQWSDYFNRAEPAVESFNKSLADKDLSGLESALDTLADSPDKSLNNLASSTAQACREANANGCLGGIDKVRESYNSALEKASKEGLVKVQASPGS